jgi:dGTPase
MYQHERVVAIMKRAQRIIAELFDAYVNDSSLLPRLWQDDVAGRDKAELARKVCDFIAGMTDRYAIDQHRALFDLDPSFVKSL